MNCIQGLTHRFVRFSCAVAACVCAAATTSATSQAATELPDPTIIANAPAFPTYDASYFLDDSFAWDYASQGQGTNTFVDFDFGAATLITEVLYTDRTTSGGGNGTGGLGTGGPADNVQGYSLIFDDAADFATPLHSQAVLSPGFSNTDPPVLVNGGLGISARYVRFDVTASNGQNVGGSEIQFFTVPEPTGAALVAVGAVVLSHRRRRR
jgi:hypothetical protein